MTYNIKKIDKNIDLDSIIKNEYKRTIEILNKYDIIKHIERQYGINYKIPELVILEDEYTVVAGYSDFENKIIFFKKSIKKAINTQLKFLGYKEIKRFVSNIRGIKYLRLKDDSLISGMFSELLENRIIFFKKSFEMVSNSLKSLGYKEIEIFTNNTQGSIEYLNISYNTILSYPFYINKKNIREAIAKAISRLSMYHEFLHSFDFIILYKLKEDPTIKRYYEIAYYNDFSLLDGLVEDPNIMDKVYLLTILNDYDNLEVRASAFEVIMYYLDLINNLNEHEKLYIASYVNIPICRNYIEKINILEKSEYTSSHIPYDLGRCYGNIIVAKYKSSLEENIYNIVDDILHLDKEKAIDMIKLYGDNLEWLLYNKNSNRQ